MYLAAEKAQGLRSPKPRFEARNPALVLAVMGAVSFMVAFDVTALNVALPGLGRELAVGLDTLQWVAAAYALASASLLLAAGALCDRWGAYRFFLIAVVSFGASSALCGLGGGATSLIVARVLQGASAAALLPASMALLTDAYPDTQRRSRAMAAWGGISATALVMGPLAGGYLAQAWGWRSIFFVNVPLCLLALPLTWAAAGRPPHLKRAWDLPGQVAATMALFALSFAIIEGHSFGWATPPIVGMALAGVLALGVFLVIERRQRQPMLPPALFASGGFTAAVLAGFAYNLAYYGALFCLPIALQARGVASSQAGLMLVPMTATTALLASASGWVAARTGTRTAIGAGMLCGAAGACTLLVLDWSHWSLAVGGMLVGAAGATLPLIVATALAHLPAGRVGIGTGVFNTARQSGGALGVAMLGAMLQGEESRADHALAAIALVFAAASAWVFFRLERV